MIWDACLARAVAGELAQRLAGQRLRAVTLRRETRQASVCFREVVLVADMRPGRGFVLVEPATEPPDGTNSPAAVLAGIEAPFDERALVLRFRRLRGAGPAPALVADFATNRWNVLLAEGPELVVRQRLVATRAATHRIGARWTPGGGGRRIKPDTEEWKRLVGRRANGPSSGGLRRNDPRRGADADNGRTHGRLLARVAYASSVNAGHLADAPTADEGFARWATLAEGSSSAPHVLQLAGGPQPYPWPLSGMAAAPAPSLLDGMREAARAGPGDAGPRVRAAQLLEAEIGRLGRKADRLRGEIAKAAEAGAMRDDATLILSSLRAISPNATAATLAGFDGRPRTIPLPPGARPQDHANALFRRAARMERALPGLAADLRATRHALKRAEEMQRRNANGEMPADQLADAGRASRRPGPPAAAPPYRTYRSSGGLEIRVGRGARENDQLTFRHARPNDIWLHARHAAGAHVVLCWNRPERPPAADLEQAAVLAANHSRARGSSHVPVDWTRRKWVRKPRGAPPGLVAPERVETVFAAPDAGLDERLAVANVKAPAPASRRPARGAARGRS